MSQKNHNYTKHFESENFNTETSDPVEPIPEETEAVSEIIGVVTGCENLRVRKGPDASAEISCTIPAGTKVMIDSEESTSDFYAICTEAGIEGYCMKKFINVES